MYHRLYAVYAGEARYTSGRGRGDDRKGRKPREAVVVGTTICGLLLQGIGFSRLRSSS